MKTLQLEHRLKNETFDVKGFLIIWRAAVFWLNQVFYTDLDPSIVFEILRESK